MQRTQLLNIQQVAAVSKISRQRLYVLLKGLRGPPEYTYINGHPVFDADVVFQWIYLRNKTKQNVDLYTTQVTREYAKPPSDEVRDVAAIVKRARKTVIGSTSGREQLDIYAAVQQVPVNEVSQIQRNRDFLESLVPKEIPMTMDKWKRRIAAKST